MYRETWAFIVCVSLDLTIGFDWGDSSLALAAIGAMLELVVPDKIDLWEADGRCARSRWETVNVLYVSGILWSAA